ncbi:hypothetical protein [Actinomyces weissii]|uniref:Uncharacterized protein n=1 Tax=Actinomyces weissii TaxID=675090 RepID=A0A7T7M8I9_9ACTO|nr:hypothetical protein [Actinomyces weissii]QQM66876.1 hypothetical protein JG540_07360 [Actinomyces weissii]
MHPSSRTVALLSTISLAALTTIQHPAAPYSVATASTGEANVVVVARFKGDTVGDQQTGLNARHPIHKNLSRWTQLKAQYTSQPDQILASVLSLDAYIRHVSANQRKVSSFFPQDASGPSGPDTQVTYIDLPRTKTQYESASTASTEPAGTQLLQDVVAALDALDTPASAQWDTNQDHQVDHLSVLVQVSVSEPVTASSPLLWPHHGRLSASTGVDGLAVSDYSLLPARHTETDSPDYTLGLGDSTVKQEYLGVLGLPPLYRSEAEREDPTGPVGPWDPRAKAANQLPLAQSREDLGWTSIQRLPSTPGNQTVTLHSFGSAAGPQAVRIASPLNPTESFVLEYRRKSEYKPGAPAPDRSLPRSGLLVYRVNPAAASTGAARPGKEGVGRDYLYVFRPGETGVLDAAGRLAEATLTAPSGRFAVAGPRYGVRSRLGSSQLSAGIQADAIVDSLGRNSGLIVEVLEQDDDSLTFRLSVPDLSGQPAWSLVQAPASLPAGALAADAASTPSVTSSPGGAVAAVAKQPDGAYAVTAFSGGAWHALGAPALDPTRQWGTPVLSWVEERLYLLAPDNTTEAPRVVLWAYEGSQWTQVAEQATTAPTDAPLLTALGTELYALAGGEGGQPQLLRLVPGQGLEPVGPQLPGPLANPVLTQTGGAPTVLAGQPDSPRAVTLRLESGAWQETHSLEQSPHSQAAGTWGSGPEERSLVVRATTAGGASVELLGPEGRVLRSVPATGLPSALKRVQVMIKGGTVYLLTTSGPGDLVEVYTSPLDLAGSWARLGEVVASSGSPAALAVTSQEVLVLAPAPSGSTSGLYRFPAGAAPEAPAGGGPATSSPAGSASPGPQAGPGTAATTSPTGGEQVATAGATSTPGPGVPAPDHSSTAPSAGPSARPSALPVPNPRPSPTRGQATSTHLPEPSPQAAPTPASPRHPGASTTGSPSDAPAAGASRMPRPTPLAPTRPPQSPPAAPTAASPSVTAAPTGSAPTCAHPGPGPLSPAPGASAPSDASASSPAVPRCDNGSRTTSPAVGPTTTPLPASAPARPTGGPAVTPPPGPSDAAEPSPATIPEQDLGNAAGSATPEATPSASALPVPPGTFPLPPSAAPRPPGSSMQPPPLSAPVAQAAGARSPQHGGLFLPAGPQPGAAVAPGTGLRFHPPLATLAVLAATGLGAFSLLRARRGRHRG